MEIADYHAWFGHNHDLLILLYLIYLLVENHLKKINTHRADDILNALIGFDATHNSIFGALRLVHHRPRVSRSD